MSRLRLRENLFMAKADGLVIFLDLGDDRYFALNSELSSRLQPMIDANGEGADEDIVRRLRLARVIEETQTGGRVFAPTETQEPCREVDLGGVGCLRAASAAACRWRADHALRRKHLSDIIGSRRLERLRWIGQGAEQGAGEQGLIQAASAFAAARALRGARDACLKEALALLYYLGRQGGGADWVFAVKGAPFAAHCWIQLGDIVLNDSVENVRAYTPIMVA